MGEIKKGDTINLLRGGTVIVVDFPTINGEEYIFFEKPENHLWTRVKKLSEVEGLLKMGIWTLEKN